MGTRFPLVVAATLAAVWSLPVTAAQYEKTGNWVFNSQAFAELDDGMLYACTASTESVEGTELSLRLAPTVEGGLDAGMTLSNDAWGLDEAPLRARFDIGANHWILPGQGGARTVEVSWTGDAAVLIFLEDLASSSFAGLIGGSGATVAQFSLRGSRGAIEAMKSCVEDQIGRGLAEVFEAGTGSGGANPF